MCVLPGFSTNRRGGGQISFGLRSRRRGGSASASCWPQAAIRRPRRATDAEQRSGPACRLLASTRPASGQSPCPLMHPGRRSARSSDAVSGLAEQGVLTVSRRGQGRIRGCALRAAYRAPPRVSRCSNWAFCSSVSRAAIAPSSVTQAGSSVASSFFSSRNAAIVSRSIVRSRSR